jgi:hypothetical protein
MEVRSEEKATDSGLLAAKIRTAALMSATSLGIDSRFGVRLE